MTLPSGNTVILSVLESHHISMEAIYNVLDEVKYTLRKYIELTNSMNWIIAQY